MRKSIRINNALDELQFIVDFSQRVPATKAETAALVTRVSEFIWPSHGASTVGGDGKVDLPALQKAARDLLVKVVKGGAIIRLRLVPGVVRIPMRPLPPAATNHNVQWSPQAPVVLWGGPSADLLCFRIIRLIEDIGIPRLAVCQAASATAESGQVCGRLYVKRTRKEFCSTKCQSRVYMRRLRAEERKNQPQRRQRGKTTRTR